MAIVSQDTQMAYGNTLSATVQTVEIVQGPQISPVKNPAYANDGLDINWDDPTKTIIIQVATNPDCTRVITTVIGQAGNMPVNIKLSAGTYWLRARWQSTNIQASAV